MSYHDNQLILGDLFEQFHNLDTCFAVQSAGRFVRQEDIRVIDKGTGDSHTLHLTAGHLVRLLVELVAQTHLFEGFLSTFSALGLGHA